MAEAMHRADEHPLSDREVVENWARQESDLKKLKENYDILTAKIESAENMLGHATRSACELVDNLNERRVFKISHGLVLVERFRKKAKKHRAGTEAPPAEYGVRISVLEVEE